MVDTIIRESDQGGGSQSMMGMFFMGIFLLILLYFVFVYGLPYMGQMFNSSQPQINVPSKIDVNLNQK